VLSHSQKRIDQPRTQAADSQPLPPEAADYKLSRELFIFSSGLMAFAPVLWMLIYKSFGLQFSTTVPLIFVALSALLLMLHFKTGNLTLLAPMQLALFLFGPFATQLTIGNFIGGSGVILWMLMAPVGALIFLGTRASVFWFCGLLVLLTGAALFDVYVGENATVIPRQTVAASFAINFAAISTLVYFLLRYFVRESTKNRGTLQAQHTLLKREQERSERLLLNILPGPIASRLKAEERNIADGFADVTVMFADIVNFTKLSEELAPSEMVALLNDIFSSFDLLAEKHGLEKIKTIGDAYMVAGGLETAGRHHYADAIADMALEMRQLVGNFQPINGGRLEIRIGIGTGPVVAGVIGVKKFIYDLWGDTVNIASRMTTEGQAGSIQVDTVTFKRLQSRFLFDEAQTIQAKGKGLMASYRLIRKRESAQKQAAKS
jgi:adenylate cyclase